MVKSISFGNNPPSAAFSQVQASSLILVIKCDMIGREKDIPAGLDPQEQTWPLGTVFSVEARSQVHSPARRAPIGLVLMIVWKKM